MNETIQCETANVESAGNDTKNGAEPATIECPSISLGCLVVNANKVRSPQKRKLRLEVSESVKSPTKKMKFQYGNYNRYYGYRNSTNTTDVRLDAFKEYTVLFDGKEVLDIGCNDGLVTRYIAKHLNPKNVVGIDIDKDLIARARKYLTEEKTRCTGLTNGTPTYPANCFFRTVDYVLPDPHLLELEQPRYDVIMCLSVTKWIHLNHGDAGLQLVFKRIYRQLQPHGILILEAQPWSSYHRRKRLTELISANYASIKMRPTQFQEYLLSPEIGFREVEQLEVPPHICQGFRRPIQVFVK